MERIETTILRNLVYEEEYSRKVIPFIQPDYFENRTEKIIFEEIAQFIVKYGCNCISWTRKKFFSNEQSYGKIIYWQED